MSNTWFKFKQFTIHQDRCAMKVGTDAILLGSWCNVERRRTALDIGTGTGILPLMLAQRNANLQITAIDIDEEAISQARENISQTLYAPRIVINLSDFNNATFKHKFDLIVSNPPYHEEEVFCPDENRNNARHTSSLSFETLIHRASELLEDDGILSLVVPTSAVEKIIGINPSLYLIRKTDIFTTPKKKPKRTLLEFSPTPSTLIFSSLFMRNEDNEYTDDYIQLTQDFYLDK